MTKSNKSEELKKSYNGLKAFLILNNIEQDEVAKILCIDIKILINKLNGYSEFTFDEVMGICDKYNCSSDIFSRNSDLKICKTKE
jgi:hypothetical protein